MYLALKRQMMHNLLSLSCSEMLKGSEFRSNTYWAWIWGGWLSLMSLTRAMLFFWELI